jgi:putative addiction module killer protein
VLEILKSETFEKWFKGLRDKQAQARINVRIRRLSLGNPGDVKPVGAGVSEMRIDYGPGYRDLLPATRASCRIIALWWRQGLTGPRYPAGDRDRSGMEEVNDGH